ncbi:MAG TPA: O-antigen ligase family protein [Gaiellaceae bacterium]|nr:O-antigen ligase family protein [Gaiellaceae bacterium]
MQSPALAGRAALVAAAGLLAAALFFGDGTSNGRLFWIGALAVLAAGAVALGGGVPVPRGAGLATLCLLAGLTAWVGLTMWWSIAPDLSWAAFDRLLAYGSVAVLGLLAARAPRPARTAAAGLAVLVGLVLAWALLGKVIPSLFPDGARVARLRNPVGYWNSLALVAATGVPLGLWAACGRRFHPAARAAGALLVYLAELVVVLTYSRAGIAVAAVAALAWLAIERDRLETLATLVLVTPVAGLVALWAFSRPALTDDGQAYADRVNDGAWFGVLLCLGAAAIAAAAYLAAGREIPPERRRSLARTLGVVVAVAAIAAVAAVAVVKGGRVLDEFRGAGTAEVSQSPDRLAELSSSNRWTWWKEAWRLFEDAPAGGKGAATFEVARRGIRTGSIVTTEPHDLPLQFLAETGLVGCLLLLALIAAGSAAAVAAIRRVEPAERGAAVAVAIGAGAFALHSLVDIHWEFVAVGLPAFFALGLLAGLGAGPARRLRLVGAPVAAAAGLAMLYSLTAPYAAGRLVDSAYTAIDDGRIGSALSDGRSARWLNPLAPDPLLALGDAESAVPDDPAALRYYRDAVRLQPENSSTWYALGSFELFTGRYRAALHDLDRAYGLDPYGPAGRPGGLLDQARAKVEGR